MLQCYDPRAFPEEYLLHTEAAGAAPPDAFGPFRVLHQIGAGALGPVFRAYDPDQDRLVAVKLFQLELPLDTATRLVDEFQRLIDRDLAHPAITSPIATGLVNGFAYLVQDFAAADSLDTITREFGPAPIADAARIAAQLAGALDFAAAVGVWHGALHPRDILIASEDARLTGCGVVQALESVGVAVPARARYAAPERLAGTAWDRRADVFSLGAIVAEMLAIQGIAGGPGTDATAGSRASSDGVSAGGRVNVDDAALDRVLARATSEQPADRFATALAFVDALKQLVVEQDTEQTRTMAALPLLESRAVSAGALQDRPEMQLPLDVALDDLLPGGRTSEPHDPDLTLTMAGPGLRDDWELQADQRPESHDRPFVPDVAEALDESEAAPALATAAAAEASASPVASARPPADRPAPADRLDRAPIGEATTPRAATASSVWPITLALVVGLVVGVAIGFFGFGNRPVEAPAVVSAVEAPPVPALSSAPAGRVAPAAPAEPPPAVAAPPAAENGTPATASSSAPPSTAQAGSGGGAAGPSRPPTATVAAAPAPRSVPPIGKPAPAGADVRRTASDDERPPVNGRLLVRSSPAGALVLLDGKEVGTTPLTLRALSFGTHSVRVTRPGYAAEERRISLSTTQPAQSLAIDLARPAANSSEAGSPAGNGFVASLRIESRPAGADVFVDGRRVGTTPLTLDALATGSHVVRLELDGYRRWTSSVRVAAGERNRVTASLEQ